MPARTGSKDDQKHGRLSKYNVLQAIEENPRVKYGPLLALVNFKCNRKTIQRFLQRENKQKWLLLTVNNQSLHQIKLEHDLLGLNESVKVLVGSGLLLDLHVKLRLKISKKSHAIRVLNKCFRLPFLVLVVEQVLFLFLEIQGLLVEVLIDLQFLIFINVYFQLY
ncbi:hypothetical protein N7526_001660 [Penicillium atrosanguineum]|nr:hypothetical protein N7526_001660 [Penicillium atrosanguineum]